MAQGSFKAKGGGGPAKGKGKAAKAKREVSKTPRGLSAKALPKDPKQRARTKELMKITKAINNSGQQQAAAKAFQNQEKMFLGDVKALGRELAVDIKRAALKKRRTRTEEKLEAKRAKLDRLDARET